MKSAKFALLSLLGLLFVAYFSEAQEQTLTEKINSIQAVNARMQSDLADLKGDVRAIGDKLDAFIKIQNPSATFVAAPAWGSASFSTTQPQPSTAATSWSSYSAMTGMGSCSNGSCGSGSGRVGLFGRRR